VPDPGSRRAIHPLTDLGFEFAVLLVWNFVDVVWAVSFPPAIYVWGAGRMSPTHTDAAMRLDSGGGGGGGPMGPHFAFWAALTTCAGPKRTSPRQSSRLCHAPIRYSTASRAALSALAARERCCTGFHRPDRMPACEVGGDRTWRVRRPPARRGRQVVILISVLSVSGRVRHHRDASINRAVVGPRVSVAAAGRRSPRSCPCVHQGL